VSGETERDISAWTNDTVLAHLRMLLDERATALAAVMDERDRKYAEFRSTLGSEIDGLRTLIDDRRDAASAQNDERDRRYEQRFLAQQEAVTSALESAKEAVAKAETATEKRFEGVNEFRAQLADQARELMPRKETEGLFAGIAERVLVLEKKSDLQAGSSAGQAATIAIIISMVVIVATIIGAVIALSQ